MRLRLRHTHDVSHGFHKATGYVTDSDIRGRCGHIHARYKNAKECLNGDAAACRRLGGYTDRRIYHLDSTGTLTEVEEWHEGLQA